MKKTVLYLFLFATITSCLSSHYSVNVKGFKSNRDLWGLTIYVLKVDSINQKGFPAKYTVIRDVYTTQKGDHQYDDSVKEYGYNFKPQKKISFTKKSKYYYWNDSPEANKLDLLPITFQNGKWYLFTNWQSASTGGGIYNLFVFVNEKGKFEKHFDIHTGSW